MIEDYLQYALVFLLSLGVATDVILIAAVTCSVCCITNVIPLRVVCVVSMPPAVRPSLTER